MTKAQRRQKLVLRILERDGCISDLDALRRSLEQESGARLGSIRLGHLKKDLTDLSIKLEQVYLAPRGHYLWIPAIYHGTDFGSRLYEGVAEKETIAAHVVEKEIAGARDTAAGPTVLFLDSGSTAYAVAREMVLCGRDWTGLPTITHSIAVVRWLMRATGLTLSLLGGTVDSDFAVMMAATGEMLERVKGIASGNRLLAVLGVNGVFEGGLVVTNVVENDIKRTLLEYACNVVVACEASKIGNRGGGDHPFGNISEAGAKAGGGSLRIVTTTLPESASPAAREAYERECALVDETKGCKVVRLPPRPAA